MKENNNIIIEISAIVIAENNDNENGENNLKES